jgi:hypothetical protein
MHTALVSRLMKDRSAWELARVPVAEESAEGSEAAHLPAAAMANPALIGA